MNSAPTTSESGGQHDVLQAAADSVCMASDGCVDAMLGGSMTHPLFPEMPEQEALDLIALKAAIQKEKLDSYSWLCSLSENTPDQLKHSGFGGKTNAEAVLAGLEYSKKKISKLLAEHVRRYPDK